MALLTRALRTSAAGAALALAACSVAERPVQQASGPSFSHRVHVEEGLDCTDCHTGAEDSDEPGMPLEPQCALCHADLDAEKPPERRAASLFADGVLAARRASALTDEVIFSHSRHVAAGVECASCHGAIETTESVLAEAAVPMAECVDCHEATSSPNECATCHREIRVDRAPPSHGLLWDEVHGDVARAHTGALADDCTLCHSESSCTECHRTEMPRNHTSFWRRRGHAQLAAFDRDECSTCHQPDSCNRCHQQALPISHRGAWGGTRSNHCLSCHLPLRAEGCYTCHKDAPAHQLATPMPPNHFPGMDCRQCHGLSAPLPHADNGTDCAACHR